MSHKSEVAHEHWKCSSRGQVLKVLFVIGFPNPFPGAAWTRIRFCADAWSNDGHEVDVLGAFSYKSLHKKGVRKFGKVNLFNLIFNMNMNHPSVFVINCLMALIVSALFLVAKKPNIAIVSVPPGDVGLGALLACRLIGVKCVVDYRDEWEDYTISLTASKVGRLFYSVVKKLLTCTYTKSQPVTTVTPNFADSLKRRGLTDVRLIPNGADVTVFKPYDKTIMRRKLGLNNEDFIIVYSGIIGGYYKFDTILSALVKFRIKTKNVKLLIIGKGYEVSQVLSLSKKLGLQENVVYLGVKKCKKEIAEILSASDVGIIPGLYTEGQLPVKLFEYGACCLPIIANVSLNSIPAKLINKYGIGIAVPPVNEEKLAEAFYYIYKNESFRVAAGKKARAFVEKKFDRNKIAAEFLNLVKELA